jgi:transposase
MEATNRYWLAVATYLYEADQQVSIVNPARIKKYGESKLQRNKTDKLDAYLIADFCLTQRPACWAPLPEHLQELQDLGRRLKGLIKQRTQEQNRLKSAPDNAFIQRTIQLHIIFLNKQIKATQAEMDAVVKATPSLLNDQKLLLSIPGIGLTTANCILGELGDVSRFKNANQAVAYVGLSPRRHESGTSVNKKTRLSKMGSRRLRSALYMAALTAMRHNPLIEPFVLRLRRQNKHAMVIICAVMKKLIRYAYAVLKHRRPFDPQFSI